MLHVNDGQAGEEVSRMLRPTTAGERGQALVEFAIAILPFLWLLFGLFDGARMIFAYDGVSQAARDVARVAAVSCLTGSPWCTGSEIEAAKSRQAVQLPGGGVWAISCVDAVSFAPVSGRPCKAGDLVSVTASTPISMITPLIAQAIGPITMSATSRMEIVQ